MNSTGSELEIWLAGGDLFEESLADSAEQWIAGFDADRQVVQLKLGPYKKLFLRPKKFVKRFYHHIHPLTIESWQYRRQLSMFDDFCTVDLALDLRFQATLAYVLKNSEMLPTINQHIKQLYADIIDDVVNLELQTLADGNWIQTGLIDTEKRIALAINQVLMQQHIQSQALCSLTASFNEFPSVQLGRDSVYLNVLKKTFELNEERTRELSRQQRLLEEEEIHEKRLQLEHLRRVSELELQMQAQEAEKQRRLLEDKQEQLSQQLELEKRLYAEQLRHENELKAMRLEAELLAQETQQVRQRLAESQQLTEQLTHQAELHDKKVLADIRLQQRTQSLWQENSSTNETGSDHAEQ
ncbi:hypothetical protein RO575_16960 [Methylomonas sp. MO1]|uniref:hypothetical protein n=1 Tax=unclassified Methylomonas TaxID=2608980 RepID=UPI00037243E1|nr:MULTISPECIES: hypothetical protein [unclassified Methylomonas]MDT4291256.1 hypothetical protein [Methylomonas sp. MO1]